MTAGADDVWSLWGNMPITRLDCEVTPGLGPAEHRHIATEIQGEAWSRLCTSHLDGARRCADDPLNVRRCRHACSADQLFPLDKNAKGNYRMARLFVRPDDAKQSLAVLVLGQPDTSSLACIGRVLARRIGTTSAAPMQPRRLGDLLPARAGSLVLRTVTPLNIGTDHRDPGRSDFGEHLRSGLASRGYKLSALALELQAGAVTPAVSAEICKATRVAGQQAMRDGLHVSDVQLTKRVLRERSPSSGSLATYTVREGSFRIDFDAQAWPWVALMLLCGAGENADEGWGGLAVCD